MSLTLCVTTPEGIVLAADSRQSYQSLSNSWRVGSDTATKIIPITKWIGVTVAGPAFLKKKEEPNARSTVSFIRDYAETLEGNESVETVSFGLRKFLEQYYDSKQQLEQIKKFLLSEIEKNNGKVISEEIGKFGESIKISFEDEHKNQKTGVGNIPPLSLMIAGYDEKDDKRRDMRVQMEYIPGPSKVMRENNEKNQFGANWTGQTDVVQRIILGIDSRIEIVPFVQEAKTKLGENEVRKQLKGLGYNINWGTMTLQDAISFATLIIETTSAIQRFSDGTVAQPGGIPGVGGPVDTAILLPDKGFYWNKRKDTQLSEPKDSYLK
ncbi:MAG: hypothetical protein WAX66_04020 [Patescibacteria group bacterium]